MDPPLVNEFSFSAANPCSYSLAEIWLYPINGAEVASRMGNLGHGFGESSGHRDGSMEESTVTERSGGGCGRKRRDLSSEDESSKIVSTTTDTNDSIESNSNRMKISGSKNERGDSKAEAEGSSAAGNKSKDYIHVRARRSQATDSHSLAERARREKISERMKILQDLVPGCNKVIGKAFVLDEIINYIQCLRRQVEFLSMKLVAVNLGMNLNPSLEGFHSKDDLKMKKVIQKLRLKEVLQLLTSQKITFVSEQEGAKLPIAIV